MAIQIKCNMCGKDFDFFDELENNSIHKTLGYGSKHDGNGLCLDLCCDCLDKIIDVCRISPLNINKEQD